MGVSIHMHLEVKDSNGWHHYSAPHMYRDKVFFEMLTGMYDDPKIPVLHYAGRGLPKDVSYVTQKCFDHDKADYQPLHHISWLNSEELETLQKMLRDFYKESDKRPSEYDLEDTYFHTFIRGNAVWLHQGWDDIRFIFWFDN